MCTNHTPLPNLESVCWCVDLLLSQTGQCTVNHLMIGSGNVLYKFNLDLSWVGTLVWPDLRPIGQCALIYVDSK